MGKGPNPFDDPDAPAWPKGTPYDYLDPSDTGLFGSYVKVYWNKKYIWRTRGHNCPVCQMLSGRVYQGGFWMGTLMPGFHMGCDCYLQAVDDATRESSTRPMGIDAWIDDLNLPSNLQALLFNLMPLNWRLTFALSYWLKKYDGDYERAFVQMQKTTRSRISMYGGLGAFYFNNNPNQSQEDILTGGLHEGLKKRPYIPFSHLPIEYYR